MQTTFEGAGLEVTPTTHPQGHEAEATATGRYGRYEDMEDTKTWNKRRRPEEDASEFGVVRVFSKPAPDAEDRLRRLFTLLLEHAARERQAAPATDSPSEAEA